MLASLAFLVLAPKPVIAFLPTVANNMEVYAGATDKELSYLKGQPWPWLRAGPDHKLYTTPEVLPWANAMKAQGLPSDGGATVQPEGFGYNLHKAGLAARAVGADYFVATWIFKVKRGGKDSYNWMTLHGAFTLVDVRKEKSVDVCILKPVAITKNATIAKPEPIDVRNVIVDWAKLIQSRIPSEILKYGKK